MMCVCAFLLRNSPAEIHQSQALNLGPMKIPPRVKTMLRKKAGVGGTGTKEYAIVAAAEGSFCTGIVALLNNFYSS